MDRRKIIESRADVMHGAPVFTGTRVPVKTLFDYLEAGDSLADFLNDFPTVARGQAVELLELARRDLSDAVAVGRVAAKRTQAPSRSS